MISDGISEQIRVSDARNQNSCALRCRKYECDVTGAWDSNFMHMVNMRVDVIGESYRLIEYEAIKIMK